MENRKEVKEFRGEEEFYILMSDEIMYVNVQLEQKRAIRVKIEEGEKNIIVSEEVTVIKIKDIKELSSKKNSKDIDITAKDDIFAMFTAETKEERENIFKEIKRLLGEKCEINEKKYSMFRRVITPACYTAAAAVLGAGMVWLATAQPVLVKRDMVVRRSVATIIKTLQLIEGMGVENAKIGAMVLVIIPILYMALRVVKPPVKIVISAK